MVLALGHCREDSIGKVNANRYLHNMGSTVRGKHLSLLLDIASESSGKTFHLSGQCSPGERIVNILR